MLFIYSSTTTSLDLLFCQVLSAKCDSELNDTIKDGCLDVYGYGMLPTVSTKEQFAKAIVLHHLIYTRHTELSQLRKGLIQTLQFGKVIEDHPFIVRPLLVALIKPLNAAQIQDMFRIEYHEGSNARKLEENVIIFLFDFLQSCEG